MDRVIFHCDCDSFFASVEETFHPEYKLVPMAVAGDPETRRGIILAKNQKAKAFGVKTAETIWSAKQKCPDLQLAPPRRHAYSDFSHRVNAIYEEYTDRVERFGIDESFLDVTGSLHLFGGDPTALARTLQRRISETLGITISVGISWNRIYAKLGSDQRKPNGVFVITRENYKDIVWPLPATDLFLVGRNTAETLHRIGIKTIGELACADEAMLRRTFGKMGEQMHIYASGLDDSPVAASHEEEQAKSIGNGMTFSRNLETLADIRTGVIALSDSVASRMRRAGMKCSTVQVTIKDAELKSIQRQKSTPHPTWLAAELVEIAMEVIEANWRIGKPIRLITITAQNLLPFEDTAVEQTSLFDTEVKQTKKAEKLELAMDEIRARYGSHSVQSGVILQNNLGISYEDPEDD